MISLHYWGIGFYVLGVGQVKSYSMSLIESVKCVTG